MTAFTFLFPILLILLPQSILATDTDFVGHIQVHKQTIAQGSERYSFQVCIQGNDCETLGQEHGYSANAIKGLSGGWQRRAGAPALLIVEGVVGGVVAFATGWVLFPAVTSTATVTTVLGGGVATGTAAPSLTISSDSKWRWLSPAHHWETGKVKIDLEKNVRALSQVDDNEATAVIYATEDIANISDLLETSDQIVRILNKL